MKPIAPTPVSLVTSLVALLLVATAAQPAAAQALLAQESGSMSKMALGWIITLVLIAIGLLVVLRPSKRSLKEKKQPAPPPR